MSLAPTHPQLVSNLCGGLDRLHFCGEDIFIFFLRAQYSKAEVLSDVGPARSIWPMRFQMGPVTSSFSRGPFGSPLSPLKSANHHIILPNYLQVDLLCVFSCQSVQSRLLRTRSERKGPQHRRRPAMPK